MRRASRWMIRHTSPAAPSSRGVHTFTPSLLYSCWQSIVLIATNRFNSNRAFSVSIVSIINLSSSLRHLRNNNALRCELLCHCRSTSNSLGTHPTLSLSLTIDSYQYGSAKSSGRWSITKLNSSHDGDVCLSMFRRRRTWLLKSDAVRRWVEQFDQKCTSMTPFELYMMVRLTVYSFECHGKIIWTTKSSSGGWFWMILEISNSVNRKSLASA